MNEGLADLAAAGLTILDRAGNTITTFDWVPCWPWPPLPSAP
jgi:hypothetical protein